MWTINTWIFISLIIGVANAGAGQSTPKSATKIAIKDATIAVSGAEADSLGQPKALTLGQKHSSVIPLEGRQQLQIKFTIVDEKAQPLTVHQAFVIFVQKTSKQEVAYVAEPDASSKAYTFELDLKTHAKEFAGVSGPYEVHVILGDALVSNPIDWVVAEVKLTVPAQAPVALPKSQQVTYDKKPEIKHLFREPEKRPPSFAADIFAVACAAPLLILLVSWLRIGFNFGNLPISLWVPLFHVAFGAIFGLYFLFWVKLNMFETVKYLTGISVVAFLVGNRLLRAVAYQRKQT